MSAHTDAAGAPTGAAASMASSAAVPAQLQTFMALDYGQKRTGFAVGFKAAGGIRSAKQSMDWLALMKEELGNCWLDKKPRAARRIWVSLVRKVQMCWRRGAV